MEILYVDPGKHIGATGVSELRGAEKMQSGFCTPGESGL